jgi:hypothetical protein
LFLRLWLRLSARSSLRVSSRNGSKARKVILPFSNRMGKRYLCSYSADGTWGSTETKIAPWLWNLPDSVKKGWRKTQYAGWKVEHITKIDKPGEVLYALDVNNSPELDAEHVYNFGVEWMLFFNAKGELVRQYQVE